MSEFQNDGLPQREELEFIEIVRQNVHSGDTIPKPDAKDEFIVKGWGKRRKERALIYLIPNHKNPTKPYQKGITESEFNIAYQHLIGSGSFSREWFNDNMGKCAEEGGCNFTTIGGVFILLGLAEYTRGRYEKKSP